MEIFPFYLDPAVAFSGFFDAADSASGFSRFSSMPLKTPVPLSSSVIPSPYATASAAVFFLEFQKTTMNGCNTSKSTPHLYGSVNHHGWCCFNDCLGLRSSGTSNECTWSLLGHESGRDSCEEHEAEGNQTDHCEI